jgi:AraC-like DNA-binding protein
LKDVSKDIYDLLNFITKTKEKDVYLQIKRLNNIFGNLISKISFNSEILLLIDNIKKHKGDISISELSSNTNLSSKQIERLFRKYIGYSAKKFANIMRFFYVFKDIIHRGTDDLSSIAYDFGYYDQAHFNKEFKKFSKFTPKDKIMSIFTIHNLIIVYDTR